MPPNELNEQIANTVKAHGVEAIEKIYERAALGAKPNTYAFWQEVKELKKQNHKTTSR